MVTCKIRTCSVLLVLSFDWSVRMVTLRVLVRRLYGIAADVWRQSDSSKFHNRVLFRLFLRQRSRKILKSYKKCLSTSDTRTQRNNLTFWFSLSNLLSLFQITFANKIGKFDLEVTTFQMAVLFAWNERPHEKISFENLRSAQSSLDSKVIFLSHLSMFEPTIRPADHWIDKVGILAWCWRGL